MYMHCRYFKYFQMTRRYKHVRKFRVYTFLSQKCLKDKHAK